MPPKFCYNYKSPKIGCEEGYEYLYWKCRKKCPKGYKRFMNRCRETCTESPATAETCMKSAFPNLIYDLTNDEKGEMIGRRNKKRDT